MFERVTVRLVDALSDARRAAVLRGSGPISTCAVAYAIVAGEECVGTDVLREVQADNASVLQALGTSASRPQTESGVDGDMSTALSASLKGAFHDALDAGDVHVGTHHWLAAVLATSDSAAGPLLAEAGLNAERVRAIVAHLAPGYPDAGEIPVPHIKKGGKAKVDRKAAKVKAVSGAEAALIARDGGFRVGP